MKKTLFSLWLCLATCLPSFSVFNIGPTDAAPLHFSQDHRQHAGTGHPVKKKKEPRALAGHPDHRAGRPSGAVS